MYNYSKAPLYICCTSTDKAVTHLKNVTEFTAIPTKCSVRLALAQQIMVQATYMYGLPLFSLFSFVLTTSNRESTDSKRSAY